MNQMNDNEPRRETRRANITLAIILGIIALLSAVSTIFSLGGFKVPQ